MSWFRSSRNSRLRLVRAGHFRLARSGCSGCAPERSGPGSEPERLEVRSGLERHRRRRCSAMRPTMCGTGNGPRRSRSISG